MSRIGKKPVQVPAGVTATVDGQKVTAKGPKGELIFVANPGRVDMGRVTRFLAAVEKGAHYIANHPQEAWEAFSATAPDLQDELNRRAWEDTRARFSQSPAALDAGRYARFEAFLKDHGLIDAIRPVADLAIDPGAAE